MDQLLHGEKHWNLSVEGKLIEHEKNDILKR